MNPLDYCSDSVIDCFNWFASLTGFQQGMLIAGIALSLFIMLRVVWFILEFLGLNDIGH